MSYNNLDLVPRSPPPKIPRAEVLRRHKAKKQSMDCQLEDICARMEQPEFDTQFFLPLLILCMHRPPLA